MRNSVETVIAAPPAYVFDYLAEPMNQPEWMDEVLAVDIPEDDLVECGSRFRQEIGYSAARVKHIEYEVCTLRENEIFEYTTVGGSYPVTLCFELSLAGDETLVAATENASPPGIYYKVLRPMVKWAVKRRLRGQLHELKKIIEKSYSAESAD